MGLNIEKSCQVAESGAALRLSVALKLVQCDKGEAVLPTAKELAEERS